MKRFVAILITLILALSSCSALAMATYLDLYTELSKYAPEGQYDELITAVSNMKAEHPLLMSDEWEEKIISTAVQARDAFQPEFNTEYDPFADITLKWFGDHKAASPEDQCVILDNADGLILSFCLPVTPWIYIDDYTILVNGDTRFSSTVDNWDAKHFDGQACETFYIRIDYLMKHIDVDQYDSVAIRFYGKNHDDHVDFLMDEELLGYFRQVTADTVTPSDVNSVIWDWMKSIEDIVDETVMPSFAARMIRKNPVQIYPGNIPTSVYWQLDKTLSEDILNGKWSYAKGHVFLFPCRINSVNTSTEDGTYSYWDVQVLSEYGQFLRYASILIPINHPVENPPAADEVVLVVATYSQHGRWGPIFFLGYEDDVIEEAKSFTQ